MIGFVAAQWERLWHFWLNQLGGTFLLPTSSMSIYGLILTLLLAAFLAVPTGRKRMPRLRVWRRALFPNRMVTSASGRVDVGYLIFSILFAGLVISWAIFSAETVASIIESALKRLLGAAGPPTLPRPLGIALVTIGFFIAYEFAFWFDHLLSHKVRLLWQFHRVHHAAESLSLLTNFRVHPVDTIVFTNIVAVVMGIAQALATRLLGPSVHPLAIGGIDVVVILFAVGLTHLQHSHLWITFGPVWGKWLLSPAHHQIHHSADKCHFDTNLGSSLALFDRLFGTLHMPTAKREPLIFGVGTEVDAPQSWRAQLVTPFAGAIALVWRGVPRRGVAAPRLGDGVPRTRLTIVSRN
jgi:sterol desaturase/sphingolipid hydroxylase (fatty acid hydroxylase superfamily)